MQNYIDVKKLSANVISKNPCLQGNEQEKAIDVILADSGIGYNVRYVGECTTDNWKCDKWFVTFTGKGGNKQESEYHTGLGHRKCVALRHYGWSNYTSVQRKRWVNENELPVSPFACAVLYCLLSDMSCANDTFEDWCGNVGYDTDSRKALQTYLSCQENGTKLRKVFNNDLLKQIEKALEGY
jgi:hypothetical protein